MIAYGLAACLLLFFPLIYAEDYGTRVSAPSTRLSVHGFVPPADLGEEKGSLIQATLDVSTNWLARLNFYRGLAKLPPLIEDRSWERGAWKHARYMVKNDIVQHTEDPGNIWYSPEGLAAARGSVLMGSGYINRNPDAFAIDSWMQAPFHALDILDPALRGVSYGWYEESDGGIEMAAALDVVHGRDRGYAPVAFPIMWPGDGTTVPLRLHWEETPDPLTACPGYRPPSGLPILLMMGPGERATDVKKSLFIQDGKLLEHCGFNEATYINPDPYQEAAARAVLSAHNAIVLIPRSPLTPGATYTVFIDAGSRSYRWSFTVSKTIWAEERTPEMLLRRVKGLIAELALNLPRSPWPSQALPAGRRGQ